MLLQTSFLGRQASGSGGLVKAASNFGCSRSFVFGTDHSNHSNPALAAGNSLHGQQADNASAAVGVPKPGLSGVNNPNVGMGGSRLKPPQGPSSFAGLGKAISNSQGGPVRKRSKAGANAGPSLFDLLQGGNSLGGDTETGEVLHSEKLDAIKATFSNKATR